MSSDPRGTLIIGLGNPLRGDDAFGPIVAERVAAGYPPEHEDVRVIVCQLLTPEIAADCACARRVILIDAAVDGPPGELICRRLEPAKPIGSHRPLESTAAAVAASHALVTATLMAMAHELFGRCGEMWLVSIRGENFELADRQLSPTVQSAVATAIRTVIGLTQFDP